MREFPFSRFDKDKGKELLEDACVKDVVFSEGTYQVEVFDPELKESFWPFLQIGSKGELSDCFCTCDAAERKSSCRHLGAAHLMIFQGLQKPLHVRYRQSFWYHALFIASRRHGYAPRDLINVEGEYKGQSLKRKILFRLKGLTALGKSKLKEIIEEHVEETEETSIKFSNLPLDELELYREGRPSYTLQFELSFWSGIAKWLFLMQSEKKEYQVSFTYGKNASLPSEVIVKFKDVKFSLYLSEENWEELIEPLQTIHSQLKFYPTQGISLEDVFYNEDTKELLISKSEDRTLQEEFDNKLLKDKEHLLRFGKWVYHKDVGFFVEEFDPLLKKEKLVSGDIQHFLQNHHRMLREKFSSITIHPERHSLKYTLFFDENKRLHARGYLFEETDLTGEKATHYGDWVFIPKRGFFRLGHQMFRHLETIIEKDKMGKFISRNRLWLNNFEGFQIHLGSIELNLIYDVDGSGNLCFKSSEDAFENIQDVITFDEWIYIKGMGFYPKSSIKISENLKPNVIIEKEEVSSFIERHKADLAEVKGFFSSCQPVKKHGLNIELGPKEEIIIEPSFEYHKGYSGHRVVIFGDYSFVEGEGFAKLPGAVKVPEIYHERVEIAKKKEEVFLSKELPHLKSFTLYLDPRIKTPKQFVLKVHSFLPEDISSKQWKTDLVYESELGSLPLKEVLSAIKEKKNYIKSTAGFIYLSHPRFNWLRDISSSKFIEDDRLKLSSLEWLRLMAIEEVKLPDGTTQEGKDSIRHLQAFDKMETDDLLDLDGLESQLRPYQKIGVNWLWFLYSYRLSGLLCDEMGLGKTHQAMALVCACLNFHKTSAKQVLIVCPTSVIYHWEELLKKFLPGVNVLLFYGISRSLKDFDSSYDIFLTSYGTLRSDKEAISDIGFELAIFDELQMAKNAHSQTHQILKSLNIEVKIGLTGTPIENKLLELHSLYDIILPGYLPSSSQYKEMFVAPIEKHGDKDRKERLKRIVKPFLMRRKKEEVLTDLPEKIEEVVYIDLSDEQKLLYNKAVKSQARELLDIVEKEETPLPYTHIFALFSHLKQVCDHPALVNGDVKNFHKYSSGKWDLFRELLAEARESNQKVVVFTQYLKMLDIIEAYLNEEKIGFAQIRGSTTDRREELIRFREDESCEVFLGSLLAAGVGIDLVSASVVIHYDRWWNPAKENQATDRVHRIGQVRGVQVFKMVSKHTIEEHVHALIEKKMGLLHDVVGYDDKEQIKSFTRQELSYILRLLSE